MVASAAAADTGYFLEQDLNNDGIMDKIESGPSNLFGNGGGPFLVTLSQPEGKFVTQIVELHPKAASLQINGNKNQLWIYWRNSYNSGVLRTIQLDNTFKAQDIDIYFSEDRSGLTEKIFETIFHPDHLIKFLEIEGYTPPKYHWGK